MDISRLPLTPSGRPANTNSIHQAASRQVDAVEVARPVGGNRRADDVFEKVVQGELLERERTSYQSTRAFINERSAEQAMPSERTLAGSFHARSALSSYQNNIHPETATDLNQGRSVNYFV